MMLKKIIMMLLIIIYFSIVVSAGKTLLYQDDFTDLSNFTATCTVSGNEMTCTNQYAVYQNRIPNMTTNTNNATIEFDIAVSSCGTSYSIGYLTQKKEVQVLTGTGIIIKWGGYCLGNIPSEAANEAKSVWYPAFTNTWLHFKMEIYPNQTYSTYANGTYKANQNYVGSPNNPNGNNMTYLQFGTSGAANYLFRVKNLTIWNGTGDIISESVDTTPPIVNTLINNTSPKINQHINISANITDETGLSFCQVITNITGSNQYFNFSLSGTSDKCSQNFTIDLTRGNVINFTIRANDSSNNFYTNDTIITVADTLGTVSIGINNTNPKINDVLNISGNATDIDGDIAFVWIVNNQSGTNINDTYSATGFSANITNATKITVSRGNVINFTVYYNDSVGTQLQKSQLITVANTAPTITSITLNSTNGLNTSAENLTAYNSSISDNDNDNTKMLWDFRNKGVSDRLLNLPFENNSIFDLSSFTNNGTTTGAAYNSTGGYDGFGAFYFDGTNDRIEIQDSDDLDITTNISIAFWIYPMSMPAFGAIIAKDIDSTSWYVFYTSAGEIWWGTPSKNIRTITGGLDTMLQANEWNHVAVTSSSQSGSIYVNGYRSQGCCPIPGGIGSIPVTSTNIIIGELTGFTDFHGLLDDIFIWNRSISAEEVLAVYQNKSHLLHSSAIARGDNWTVAGYPTDGIDIGNQVISNNVEIVNSPPPIPNILFPLSNTKYNKQPLDLNITWAADADGDPITSARWYINGVLNQTTTLNTTLNASDGSYNLSVSLFDGLEWGINATLQNFTIDTTPPKASPSNNLTNNTAYNGNQTIFLGCVDNNIYNFTIRMYNSSNTIARYINSSPTGNTSGILRNYNFSLLASGRYNTETNCSDSHTGNTDAIINIKKGKKSETTQIFNDTTKGIATKMLTYFIDKNGNSVSTPSDIKSYSINSNINDKILFGLNFTSTHLGTRIVYDVVSTKNIVYLPNTGYKGHLIWNSYGTDFEGILLINGVQADYNVTVIQNSANNVTAIIEPKTQIKVNDIIEYHSQSIFGLNIVNKFYNFTIDNIRPVFKGNRTSVPSVAAGSSITIFSNVSDNLNVNAVKIEVRNPSGTKTNTSASLSSGTSRLGEWSISYPTSVQGIHNITSYAQDDTGIWVNTDNILTFNVTAPVTVLGGGVTTTLSAVDIASRTASMTKELCDESYGLEWYNGFCYQCEGEMKELNGVPLCYSCPTGYDMQGDYCIQEGMNRIQAFFATNPRIKFFLIIIGTTLVVYTSLQGKNIYRKAKKKKPVLNKA